MVSMYVYLQLQVQRLLDPRMLRAWSWNWHSPPGKTGFCCTRGVITGYGTRVDQITQTKHNFQKKKKIKETQSARPSADFDLAIILTCRVHDK